MCKSKLFSGMGFRHLHEFNIVLLGKQGWRLINHPESLVARLYKARYYSDGGFLNAKLGANPSFIWRSLLAAQDLLKQGLGSRVGNGQMVSILNDPLIPVEDHPYVVTTSETLKNKKVCSLFSMDDHSWDVDLIRDVFEERDADIIMAIPLHSNEPDKWYWRKEKLGIYSVKSAYTVIQENKPQHDNCGDTRFWRRLWNIKIPPKVKNFIWRAAMNCLPTKDLLRIKRVNVNDRCPLCNEEAESIVHTLISCTFARACWNNLLIDTNVSPQQSFLQWLLTELNEWTVDQRSMGIMLCWSIWKCINDVVWKKKGMEVCEVVALAKAVLNQWREAQDKNFDKSWGLLNSDDGDELWTIPTDNKIKVNTDAAIFQDTNSYAVAFAARNHKGELIHAHSSCRPGRITSECAETVVIREVLSWIKDRNLAEVIVETDCLVAVQAIRSSKQILPYFGRLVNQCKDLLVELSNKGVNLRFIKRSANNLAHTLASSSYSIAKRTWEPIVAYPDLIQVLKNVIEVFFLLVKNKIINI